MTSVKPALLCSPHEFTSSRRQRFGEAVPSRKAFADAKLPQENTGRQGRELPNQGFPGLPPRWHLEPKKQKAGPGQLVMNRV